jgi:hypothetical protein
MRDATVFVALLLTVALAACGDEPGSPELVDRIPENASGIAALDLDRARRALDFDEDFDPSKAGQDGAERRLLYASALAMPWLSRPQEVPLREAIDHSQVTAAVTSDAGFGSTAVTLLATDQSLDEVGEVLEKQGYRRDGDVLVSPERFVEVVYPAVAGADGVLAMGSDADAARAALDRSDGGGPSVELLETLGEPPVRVAGEVESDCLRGLGVADELQPARGKVVIFTENEADLDAVRLEEAVADISEQASNELELEDPDADGDLVAVEYGYEDAGPETSLTGLLRADLRVDALYEC